MPPAKKKGGDFSQSTNMSPNFITVTVDICSAIPKNFPTKLSVASTESVMCHFLFCPQILEYSDCEDIDLFQ